MAKHPGISNIQQPPSIGALTVTWNRRSDVLECIDSLYHCDYPNLVIYAVDNASSDDTLQAIADNFPSVILIKSEENLGFAAGNNLGLAKILEDGLDAAFLINDDAVVAVDALKELTASLYSDPQIGAVTPKIVLHSNPSMIWSAGGMIDTNTGISTQLHYGEPDFQQADEVSDIDYAIGCAVLVKTDVIRKVGLLDPRFFMYYEETDWCRRIRSAGYRILYVPQGYVKHKATLTSNGRNQASYYYSRNRLLYLHTSGMKASRIAWIAATDLLRSAVAHTVKGRRREGRLIARGIADYYSNTFGKLQDGT